MRCEDNDLHEAGMGSAVRIQDWSLGGLLQSMLECECFIDIHVYIYLSLETDLHGLSRYSPYPINLSSRLSLTLEV